MARIFVGNQDYEIEEGQNLLAACLSLGFDLPYFCWHPAMHSVGACRQCAIKQFRDEHDRRGRIVMACMTPVSDGLRISIEDREARAFRAGVIEWMMLSHPHDCPVCDEGGECHLQDMTVMTGHTRRRYRGTKRTFRNQDLGPFINHEMNRCIQCYRCVRFYRDYAGGSDLEAFSLRDQVYFGRHESGVLQSGFSGNLVEICPTGVFTDKSQKRHYTRPWDLQTAPSVCVHCGLGCNTIPGERYGSLRRIRNRFNSEVNGYFLCDRGRYGYEFVNSSHRLRQPLVRASREDSATPLSAAEALERVRSALAAGNGVAGIGSPRASLEANYALRRLAGPERFASGMSDADLRLGSVILEIVRSGAGRPVSLAEVRQADAVLVLGENPGDYAPLLELALRQSVRQQPLRDLQGSVPEWDDAAVREAVQGRLGPLYLATPAATRLDQAATAVFRAAPDEIARLGFAVASKLSSRAPAPDGIDSGTDALAAGIAAALSQARQPLVVSGAGLGNVALPRAAANVVRALREKVPAAGLCLTLPEANSMGAALMGGRSLAAVAAAIESGEADTLIVLENDLFRRADPLLVERLFTARQVIVLDCLTSRTAARADIVLPAAAFAESDGTLVSSEGRAQRFFKTMPPAGDVRASWRWLGAMAEALGATPAWQALDDVIRELAAELPVFADIREAAPDAGFRITGQKVARQPHRYSGRTSMNADLDVREAQPPADPDSPLSFSMEGFQGQPPGALIPRYRSPGWNSVQALNKFQQEAGGPLRGGDPGRRLIEPQPGEQPERLEQEEHEPGQEQEGQEGQEQPQFKRPEYFPDIPEPFVPRAGEWLLVPLYHIFGSEEMSAVAPAVRQLAPAAYVALSPGDAAALGAPPGSTAELIVAGGTLHLPVRLLDSLPAGVAGVPVCLPGLEGIVEPGSFARIRSHA